MAANEVMVTQARALAVCRCCNKPIDGFLTLRTGMDMGGNTIIVGIVEGPEVRKGNELHDIAEVPLREIPMGGQ